jgi:hypothetical protein
MSVTEKKGYTMAKTIFRFDLVQPIYEFPYGFYVDIKSTGGTNTQGTLDPADDTYTPPAGVEGGDEERGFWVDLKNDFECDGDVAVVGSPANLLNKYLISQSFLFNPSNPPYNTVAPYLKDGVTENPNFDNSENPVLLTPDTSYGFGDSTRAYRTMDECRRFAVATVVVP